MSGGMRSARGSAESVAAPTAAGTLGGPGGVSGATFTVADAESE
jgi:hypothetical protein